MGTAGEFAWAVDRAESGQGAKSCEGGIHGFRRPDWIRQQYQQWNRKPA